jgi:hypothetical protein
MLEVRSDRSRHVVCVFNRGPKITHYLGVENGPALQVCSMPNDQFDREYHHVPQRFDHSGSDPQPVGTYAPQAFAMSYMRDVTARAMIPVSPSAIRVLKAIIGGQSAEVADCDPHQLENIMAATKEEGGFRKPDGPVAQVHKYLDSRLDAIKAGTVSRKELIEKMEAKGLSRGTILTQTGVWARNNGITFSRPTEADAIKKEKRAAAKKAPAAKKAKTKKTKPAEAAGAEAAA